MIRGGIRDTGDVFYLHEMTGDQDERRYYLAPPSSNDTRIYAAIALLDRFRSNWVVLLCKDSKARKICACYFASVICAVYYSGDFALLVVSISPTLAIICSRRSIGKFFL